ncbi:hypothetical protein CEXT_670901 [Caerostris extrusa]|uniref:Uncharacterized protein n=1 Tax=Caerostris extrusa TaxID=172846 RepID=A0AAV4MVN3_CAEEX|nr:hypothetical protein CEXT_670901 [Caerostris extrusa]
MQQNSTSNTIQSSSTTVKPTSIRKLLNTVDGRKSPKNRELYKSLSLKNQKGFTTFFTTYLEQESGVADGTLFCQRQDFQLESCEWGACVHSKPAPTPRIHVPRLFPNGIRFYSPTRYSSREGFSSAFTPEELNDDRNEAAVSIRR